MNRLGLTSLLFATVLLSVKPSEAYLDYGDIGGDGNSTQDRFSKPYQSSFLQREVQGSCIYKNVILDLDCNRGITCHIQGTRDLQGNPISYPENLCRPLVAVDYERGKVLYCFDRPTKECPSNSEKASPSEKECIDAVSLECLCC